MRPPPKPSKDDDERMKCCVETEVLMIFCDFGTKLRPCKFILLFNNLKLTLFNCGRNIFP